MNFKVNFISDAEEDLFQIYKFVYSYDSEEMAEKIIEKIYKKCLKLQSYPERGQVPPELNLLHVQDFLEIISKPYRIIYKIENNEIFIYCILDSRRDIQRLLQERLLR